MNRKNISGIISRRPGLIEIRFARKDPSVRAVYHRSEHLEGKREMMQSWADFLDGLRENGKVIAIRKTG